MTKDQLIPPPDLAPSVPADATPEQCVAMWLDLVDATDQVLLATLRATHKSEADVRAAYRRVLDAQRREHDCATRNMLEQLHKRLHDNGE